MNIPTLEEVIRQHVHLPSIPSAKGFYPVLCRVCNDHGLKGLRAGFKFENDVVGYNCFNCGHTARYDPHEHNTLSDNMITVMNAYGITESEYSAVYLNRLNEQRTASFKTKKNIEPEHISIPKHFHKLTEATEQNTLATRAHDYLQTRGIGIEDYTFFLSRGGNSLQEAKWAGRLIIPIYKNEYLIFYQGRDLLGARKRYLSPAIARDRVIYGFDQLFTNANQPLYIVEGFFDAFMINGVAVFGNKMTETQIEWLTRSPRQKIIIPDRKGDGHLLAKQAIGLNWYVATPDIGDCKDINEAVMHYGKLYVMKEIESQTHSGSTAEVITALYCERGSRERERVSNG